MKSKLDLYNILAIEGQLYLPPLQDCSMDFIKLVMTGRKKVSVSELSFHSLLVRQRTKPLLYRCSSTTS